MPKEKHIHRYKKVDIGSQGKPYFVYRCTKLNCSHYLRPSMLPGRLAECPRCDSTFIITSDMLSLVSLHCSGCTQVRTIHA